MITVPGVSDTCAHCGLPALGFATGNAERLCHDDARDCYELVTVHDHPTPCRCTEEQS
ncbi:hypothetical protein [Kocuria sp. CCUG 69068]|uniref:hypothetical protein n=1 Tax=Kocuria sp. CCUG 69068 TaxID=2043138 RepID=UPI001E582BA6